MNFIGLCQDVARESGTLAGGGYGLTTTSSPTNVRAQQIISWTSKAWVTLQSERRDWSFMQREFVKALAPGISRYTAATLSIDRLGSWSVDRYGFLPFSVYDPDLGKADEAAICQIQYDTWRTRWDRGVHDRTRPTEYAISPRGELCVGATPDRAYQIAGEYRVSPQVLVADGDVPEMPEEYHGAIVWQALHLMANADEAPALQVSATSEYALARARMVRDLLPTVELE